MRRIKDYYNWNTLKEWKYVMDNDAVVCKDIEEGMVDDKMLYQAIMLLSNDCFPIAVTCYITKDGRKEVLITSIWSRIFDFIDNKQSLKYKDRTIVFSDLECEEQSRILDAKIFSIWMKL